MGFRDGDKRNILRTAACGACGLVHAGADLGEILCDAVGHDGWNPTERGAADQCDTTWRVLSLKALACAHLRHG
jgi:hypothetical protein